MKKTIILITTALAILFFGCSGKKEGLAFDKNSGVEAELVMPDGQVVKYIAFEHLVYVRHVEDTVYQQLNLYIPEGTTQQTPIFMRTYIGGYMAAEACRPQAGDATGRALAEGYVVAIPGARGRNSQQGEIYTGRAPAALLDLKAAVRYLRLFDKQMLGDANHIIIDGTSAGGAMAALVGATGDSPRYTAMLEAMGAAKKSDAVWAVVSFCPITDLDHADMTYEWLYCNTISRQQEKPERRVVSLELAAQYPHYLNYLELKDWDGSPIAPETYLDIVKRELIRGAQRAKDAGAGLSDSLGFRFNDDGRGLGPRQQKGEYIIDLDMARYLNYVVGRQPLKGVPAFDSYGILGQAPTGENELFGDSQGSSANFTPYAASLTGNALSDTLSERVLLMNPMNFISDPDATKAPHWYIRHGSRDRDTGFPISLNLALKLNEVGCDVDFLFAWNRPHSGDYSLDELFHWINQLSR